MTRRPQRVQRCAAAAMPGVGCVGAIDGADAGDVQFTTVEPPADQGSTEPPKDEPKDEEEARRGCRGRNLTQFNL